MKDGDVYFVDGPFKGTSSSNQDLVEFIDMDVDGSDVHRYQRTGETTVIDPDPSGGGPVLFTYRYVGTVD